MDAFWQAANQHDWTQTEHRIEYRVYHDEQGNIICYSMEDLPGHYIIVDRLTFEQVRMDLKVRNGELIRLTKQSTWKLKPGDHNTYACHSKDVTVIVDTEYPDKKFWKVEITNEES